MPSSWTVSGNNGSLLTLGDRIKRQLHAKAVNAMIITINQAVEDMKRFTATRPGAKTGKQGRVETAAMLEAIAGKAFLEGADKIVGEFGFVNRRDLYFKLQTVTGFTHYLSGDFIEPTFAMRDATVLALQNLFKKLGE